MGFNGASLRRVYTITTAGLVLSTTDVVTVFVDVPGALATVAHRWLEPIAIRVHVEGSPASVVNATALVLHLRTPALLRDAAQLGSHDRMPDRTSAGSTRLSSPLRALPSG